MKKSVFFDMKKYPTQKSKRPVSFFPEFVKKNTAGFLFFLGVPPIFFAGGREEVFGIFLPRFGSSGGEQSFFVKIFQDHRRKRQQKQPQNSEKFSARIHEKERGQRGKPHDRAENTRLDSLADDSNHEIEVQ